MANIVYSSLNKNVTLFYNNLWKALRRKKIKQGLYMKYAHVYVFIESKQNWFIYIKTLCLVKLFDYDYTSLYRPVVNHFKQKILYFPLPIQGLVTSVTWVAA